MYTPGCIFGRYFNEFEKINTPIYIVFQIDKNITILTIFSTVNINNNNIYLKSNIQCISRYEFSELTQNEKKQ